MTNLQIGHIKTRQGMKSELNSDVGDPHIHRLFLGESYPIHCIDEKTLIKIRNLIVSVGCRFSQVLGSFFC